MPDDFHADYSVVSIEPMIKSVPCQIIIIWGGGGKGGLALFGALSDLGLRAIEWSGALSVVITYIFVCGACVHVVSYPPAQT